MNIEIIAVVGLVFAAATSGRIVYERQMDVLYGSYIEGCSERTGLGSILGSIFKPLLPVVDRLRWKMRGMAYFASIAAC